MYARMAGWFNSLGFLWYPTAKIILLRCRWQTNYPSVVAANVVVAIVVVAIPQLGPQTIGMIVLSFSRLMLFSLHHAYILDKFGIGTYN
jgi:hypothetical protein